MSTSVAHLADKLSAMDDEERDTWVCGGCWALALAIHERTGAPIVAIGDMAEEHVALGRRTWVHMAVQLDDDVIVDAYGLRSESDVLDEMEPLLGVNPGEGQIFQVSDRDLSALLGEVGHISSDDMIYSREELLTSARSVVADATSSTSALT